MKIAALTVLGLVATAGTTLAQPTITLLPAANSIQIIATDVSEDGETVCGYVTGHQNFIWRRNAIPQIEIVNGGSANSASGPYSAVVGMDDTGTRFLWPYRDPNIASSPAYTGGLVSPALYENYQFTTIAPPPLAEGCDQSFNTPTDLSRDGNTVMAMAWNHCRVAPFSWTAATGWTAWATQDEFPPFGQPGYESHRVSVVSRDGSRGAGWFQSGVGYGGRTGLIWTNNGATVQRIDGDAHNVLWGSATAISADGRYVAGSMVPAEFLPPSEAEVGNKYLYRWTVEGGVEILGKVDTAPGSWRHPNVNGVTNDGRFMIGQDAFGGDRDAFCWTPETGGVKLVDYLATKGLNLTDQFITLTCAAGMSSNGRFIVGQWMDFGGNIGPFVLDMGAPVTPPQCGAADVGQQGGLEGPDMALDNNDFIVFINYFFELDPRADMGIQGGGPGQDGAFDNNDFIAFIDHFFAGC